MNEILSRIPLDGPRRKWATVSSTGYGADEVSDARRKLQVTVQRAEASLARHDWLAAPTFSLADVNAFSMISGTERVHPEALNEQASPRVHDWLRRMEERPGVKKALSYPGRMRPPPPKD
jgi:glutathione S-transferase